MKQTLQKQRKSFEALKNSFKIPSSFILSFADESGQTLMIQGRYRQTRDHRVYMLARRYPPEAKTLIKATGTWSKYPKTRRRETVLIIKVSMARAE